MTPRAGARTLLRWVVWSMLAHRGAWAARRRLLSKSDHKWWRGQLAPANATLPIPKKFVFVHIPKAAGDSFMHDAPAHMPDGSTLVGSHETSALSSTTLRRMGKTGVRVAIFRHPVRLAYSQFVFCKYVMPKTNKDFPGRGGAGAARDADVARGLDAWVRHFAGPNSSHSFNCYNPRDIQYRYAATRGVAIGPGRPEADAPRARASARHALEKNFWFVGVVEAYRETMCLFRYWTTRARPPAYCACHAPAAAAGRAVALSNITHNTPAHSTARLDAELVAGLRSLAPVDLMLYAHALHLLDAQSGVVERETGVAVLCPEKREALWASVLEDICGPDTPRDVAQALAVLYKRKCPREP